MKKAVICGAGGFIGTHLVTRLKKEGYWVRGADLKYPEYSKTDADEFMIVDLRDKLNVAIALNNVDECYQLASDMGGAQYIFSGEHDADIMHNSAQINLNVADICRLYKPKLFYSSSACIYPQEIQQHTENYGLMENQAYPANPDSEYGWEKIFSERLHMAYGRNYEVMVRIARFHNIFGTHGTYFGGKQKAPADICRQVAMAKDGDTIFLNGDGKQTRTFLYVDECIEAVRRLMECETCLDPVNIGSDEMVSINQLAEMVIGISGKKLMIGYTQGFLGVRGRSSDNDYIQEKLGWKPSQPLINGLRKTYEWILNKVEQKIETK
jgi:GDP-D-mannose 3',5'-epimerase